jgi:hypothetical protein
VNFFHATEARCAVNLANVTEIRRTTAGVTVFYCDDSDPTHLSGADAAALWDHVLQAGRSGQTCRVERLRQNSPADEAGNLWEQAGPEYHTTEPTPLEALGEPPAEAAQVVR